MKIAVISLGCSKNTVDSELLAGIFEKHGAKVEFDNLERADAVIINTCGFILDSKEESINTILNCVQLKNDGRRNLKKIFVIGCLVVNNADSLKESIPEVDGWFGVNEIEDFAQKIYKELKPDDTIDVIPASTPNPNPHTSPDTSNTISPACCNLRKLSTPPHYAYLKIAEGCNKFCSFCAIPLIKGCHKSRPKEDIIAEAKYLKDRGVKEIILISQDLTFYGMDLYGSLELRDLTEKVAALGFDWVRLHYAHPNEINDEIIKLYNDIPNVCKYLDIPLQHASTPILKSMKRNIDKEGTYNLVKRIRELVPDIAIRTTFIVGYPGETEEQFQELVQFVKDCRFERMGVFTFSKEDGTAAAILEDDVPPEVKEKRKDILMDIQQNISLERNEKFVGKTLKVIIDDLNGDFYMGRTEYDSPEVDNEVLVVPDKELNVGDFYDVKVTAADYFDLAAKVI